MTHWKTQFNYDYLGAYSLPDGKDIILEIMHSIDNALHKLYNDNINRLESRWIYGKCIN
mgnify:CR=1 FL=1